jgi:carnitine O-palmitoyltransferase 2
MMITKLIFSLIEPWFDMYLRSRQSIVLNYNPFIAFKPDPNPAQMNQAIRATNMLISSIRFMKSLRSNNLKPEIFHLNPEKSDTVFFQKLMSWIPESVSFYGAYMFNAYPLDMSQYFRLFNSTRVPNKDKDILVTDESKKHILILYRGNFFKFNVLDNNNNILPPSEIYACILHILNSHTKVAEHSIGVLTSEDRDIWANVRSRLLSLGNKQTLDAIDTSLYCIALDDFESDNPCSLGSNFLYGDAKNRWFDKNHTLIVTKNGQTAINFEHSWGDGVAILRFFNELFDDSTKNANIKSSTKPSFDRGDINKYVQKLGNFLYSFKIFLQRYLIEYLFYRRV